MLIIRGIIEKMNNK